MDSIIKYGLSIVAKQFQSKARKQLPLEVFLVYSPIHDKSIDEWTEGLHDVTAEIERVRFPYVVYPNLRQIAKGSNLSIHKAEKDGIAIVQIGIH